MRVMGFVWPLCALFAGPAIVWFYRRHGHSHSDENTPFYISVAKGTLHCGAGCTLGDIVAENLAVAVPSILIYFGLGTIFSEKIFATWAHDYLWAFGFGIIMQYFAIVPMRGLSFGKGVVEAVKADFASLTSWQVGMYGLMAIAHFWLFPSVLNAELKPTTAAFWLVMQFAMMAGFITAFPVNWWLISSGVKEKM